MFASELEALLNRYPEIQQRMANEYAEDPADERWVAENGWSEYDPQSPTFVNGWVLVVTCSNMDGWEDVQTLDPVAQSHFTRDGLLYHALHLA